MSISENSVGGAPVRFGLIGASSRGLKLSMLLKERAGAVLVGLADPNARAHDRARKRLKDDHLVCTLSDAELYDRVDCEAVVIASGDPYHADNTEAALDRGKHIYLEKPLTQTLDELRRVVELWQASDRVVMAGLELRRCILFREMRRLIDEGAIGRVVIGMAFDNVAVGGRFYYHNRSRKRSYIRSLVIQKGTHTIDLLHWLMGKRARSVFSLGGQNVFGLDRPEDKRCRNCDEIDTCRHAVRGEKILMDYGELKKLDDICVYAKGSDVDDNTLMLIDYDDNARAFYGECHFTPEYTREFTFIGDQGKMTGFYNNDAEFTITVRRCDAPTQMRVLEPRPEIEGGHGGSDPLAMEEFARRVRAGERAEDEFWEVVESTAVAIAACDSAETGRPVDVPSFR